MHSPTASPGNTGAAVVTQEERGYGGEKKLRLISRQGHGIPSLTFQERVWLPLASGSGSKLLSLGLARMSSWYFSQAPSVGFGGQNC